MDNSLRIALWNADGLPQHKLEVEKFLKLQRIDILLISETHFTKKNYFKIAGYNIYDSQHPSGSARGGSAIIIKENITHYEIDKYQESYLQATCIKIKCTLGSLVVAAVYCPPGKRILQQQFEAYFHSLGPRFISGGDYNSKHTQWGARLITPRGTQLHQAMLANGYGYASTGEPTYWPTDVNKIPDLLDFFVTHGISCNYIDVASCSDLSSDHSPIIATISTTIIKRKKTMSLTNKYTNWELYRRHLEETTFIQNSLENEEDVDKAIKQITRNIHDAAKKATPLVENRGETISNYPKHVRDKIAEKRQARRKWQYTRNPNDKRILNKLTKDVKNLLREITNKKFHDYINSLSPNSENDYSLWKATKKLKRPKQTHPPIRKADGSWARSEKEKATRFAEHLFSVFQPLPCVISKIQNDTILKYLDTPLQLSLPPKHFTPGKIKEEINSLKNKKAPGNDLITPKMLKELPKKTLVQLTQIYNAILRTQYFPLCWKTAEIILIHKPGKPENEAASYRPISLLPILSKILEKLILKQLKPIIEDLAIIPNHQFGFREQHSTIDQVHRLVNIIEKDLEEKKVCTAVFLDISQAFDRVWHTGLLYKIKKLLPHQYFLLLKSYLSKRHFKVKYGNAISSEFQINAGVPQGSVLGPTLYQLFTSDIPNEDNTITATYADDTAFLSSHVNPNEAANILQNSLNKLQLWLDTWRIKVNETKSNHVTFTNRRVTCPQVTLKNQPIPITENIKYLGIHLDKRLTWKKHLSSKRSQLNIKTKKLNWLIGRKSQLSLENKLLIYKIILKPIWTYGIQLWGCAKNSNINIIQRFQNKALRKITNAPWYVSNQTLHRDLKIPLVKEEISKYAKRHINRLNFHPNELALNLLNNEDEVRRLKRRKPLDLIL